MQRQPRGGHGTSDKYVVTSANTSAGPRNRLASGLVTSRKIPANVDMPVGLESRYPRSPPTRNDEAGRAARTCSLRIGRRWRAPTASASPRPELPTFRDHAEWEDPESALERLAWAGRRCSAPRRTLERRPGSVEWARSSAPTGSSSWPTWPAPSCGSSPRRSIRPSARSRRRPSSPASAAGWSSRRLGPSAGGRPLSTGRGTCVRGNRVTWVLAGARLANGRCVRPCRTHPPAGCSASSSDVNARLQRRVRASARRESMTARQTNDMSGRGRCPTSP